MTSGFTPHRIDPRHCDKCQHWGGWAQVMVGGKVDMSTHGICLHPKLSRGITAPAQGCAFWRALTAAPPDLQLM
jgi:hypothetical protein